MVKDDLIERYHKYTSEEDPNDEQGIKLVDQIIERWGSIENALKQMNKGDKEAKSLKKENNLEKGLTFVKRANGMSVNVDNLFVERNTKEKLIREYKGDKKYLSGFSDYRIGTIFSNLYYSALKKSKK